jgi:DNA-binding response OmpR family regulator
MAATNVLVAIRREHAARYYKSLAAYRDLRVNLVSSLQDVVDALTDKTKPVDVLVLDANLGDTHDLIADVRHSHSRLIIILVDEEADFAMPGPADEVTTQPFHNDELARKINRLMSDRRTETLRADTLPQVRVFAKKLINAVGEGGKYQAAVEAAKEMSYDYVGYYKLEALTPLTLTLKAQEGPNTIKAVAPKTAQADDIMGTVGSSGKSIWAGMTDSPTHPLVAKGRLGAVVCVPVSFSGKRYGVLVACREQPGTINQEHVMMLELVSSQLGAALSKETIS